MINFYQLDNKVTINGLNIYLPKDPFGVYKRLFKIFIKNRQRVNYCTFNNQDKFVNIFKHLDWIDYEYKKPDVSFSFLIWVHQSIPVKFWLYNNFITANLGEIKESAQKFNDFEIWIDTPKVKNKVKLAKVEENLIRLLKNKQLCLPDYDIICSQIYEWGNKTKYKYGIINDVLIH
jgi:hypothetical protein